MIGKIIDYYAELFKNSVFWNSLELWRNICFLLLILLSTAYLFRQIIRKLFLRKEEIEHDKKVFNRSNGILPERKILDSLEIYEGFYRTDNDYLRGAEGFCRFFEETGNSYLNKNLNKSSKQLVSAIRKLQQWGASRFFIEPRMQAGPNYTFELFPEDIDDHGRKSERLVEAEEQLPKLTNEIRLSYLNYRRLIKKRLLI